MKTPLKLSLVLSVLICAQADSNIYYQHNCVGTSHASADDACCRDVSLFGALPICSAGGSGSLLSTRVDVYTSSDCVNYYSHSYGRYSNPSRTIYPAKTENFGPRPPINSCPIGSKCPSPYGGGNIMIEGKIYNGQVKKLQSNKIPPSIGYTDGVSIKTYYILLTNPAAKRLEWIHPSDHKLDYFKEHYDILEARDENDNLVEMSFNPKNNQ